MNMPVDRSNGLRLGYLLYPEPPEPPVFDRARQLIERARGELAKQGRLSLETMQEMRAAYHEMGQYIQMRPEFDPGIVAPTSEDSEARFLRGQMEQLFPKVAGVDPNEPKNPTDDPADRRFMLIGDAHGVADLSERVQVRRHRRRRRPAEGTLRQSGAGSAPLGEQGMKEVQGGPKSPTGWR